MKMDYGSPMIVNAESNREHSGSISGDTFIVYKNGKRLATILSTDEGILLCSNKVIGQEHTIGNVLLIKDND